MKIKTKYDPPPIPTRVVDWWAIDDDTYEPGSPIGYGATEQDAIDDLMAQFAEQDLEMYLAEELNHPQAREDD